MVPAPTSSALKIMVSHFDKPAWKLENGNGPLSVRNKSSMTSRTTRSYALARTSPLQRKQSASASVATLSCAACWEQNSSGAFATVPANSDLTLEKYSTLRFKSFTFGTSAASGDYNRLITPSTWSKSIRSFFNFAMKLSNSETRRDPNGELAH